MLVLLDSTVLIDYLRGGRPAVDRVRGLRARRDVACTTGINVEEVVRGMRDSERQIAGSLFGGLAVVRIGVQEGWQAGVWRRDYALRGVTLWQADCLIAACALAAGARLATGNPADFPMEEIEVEHWPVGQ